MTFGLSSGAISLIGAGSSLLGGALGSSAAGDAAQTQAQSTAASNALLQKQYDTTRSDLAPYRNYGSAATTELMRRLGLGGTAGGAPALTADQARQQLLGQYTTQNTANSGWYQNDGGEGTGAYWERMGDNGVPIRGGQVGLDDSQYLNQPGSGGSTVDEAGLNDAVQKLLASQGPSIDSNSAGYGSLLQDFTGADLANSPGYQFGLQQGQQQIDNQAAKGGSYFSGGALKAAARFGNDYAGTKFNEAYNRDSTDKTRTYNFLNGGVSTGQNAAAQTGNTGTSIANSIANNTSSLGDATAASQIGSANAINTGINNGINSYNQNSLINKLTSGNTSWGSATTTPKYNMFSDDQYSTYP